MKKIYPQECQYLKVPFWKKSCKFNPCFLSGSGDSVELMCMQRLLSFAPVGMKAGSIFEHAHWEVPVNNIAELKLYILKVLLVKAWNHTLLLVLRVLKMLLCIR